MDERNKQKLCWNCEARVDCGVENCPSCGVYLSTSPILEQSQASYTTPPYRFVANEQESVAPASPYVYEKSGAVEESVLASQQGSLEALWKREMVPLTTLVVGSSLLLFSLVLLFFSTGGVLTLTWNAHYWYFYLFFSLPLLFVGWKTLEATVSNVSK